MELPIPLSFIYGGRHSAEFIHSWKHELHEEIVDDTTCMKTFTVTDPDTGLQIKAEAQIYLDTPGNDWTVYFTNTGTANTPIIEGVRPLDTLLSPQAADHSEPFRFDGLMFAQNTTYTPGDDKLPVLCRMKGSVGCVRFSYDEFQPIRTTIRKGEAHVFGVETGYSSSFDHYSPFFELMWAGGGAVIAMGWSGKWTASVEGLEDGRIRVAAGMADLHTYLKPGETIRTPRILQANWAGDDSDIGYNLFRQIMIKHIMPRVEGQLVFPPISSPCVQENLAANHDNQMHHILHDMNGLDFEAYWLDAWWHKGGFPHGMGSYTYPIAKAVDPERFPQGIKPLSEAVHDKGYKFLLWFAPETAWEGSAIWHEHPHWLLSSATAPASSTVNLGIPEAREYMTKLMDAYIKTWGVNVWRTDSGPVAAHFQDNDTDPDRKGILEIRYYEGLYRLWDDLLAMNPGLMIDNCSGGGTRIDLETSSRSIALWRTDSTVWSIGTRDYTRTPIVNDVINASLNRYVPFSLSGSIGIEPYYIRSGFNGGLSLYDALPQTESSRQMLNQAIAECKRMRAYLVGDFYRLIYQSHDPREWCVYQYHLPDERGVIVALRRPESPFPVAEVNVKRIDRDSEYELSYFETYGLMKKERITGADMMQLKLEIATKPGSLLIKYNRVP